MRPVGRPTSRPVVVLDRVASLLRTAVLHVKMGRVVQTCRIYTHSGQSRSPPRRTSEYGISALLAWSNTLRPNLEVIDARSM